VTSTWLTGYFARDAASQVSALDTVSTIIDTRAVCFWCFLAPVVILNESSMAENGNGRNGRNGNGKNGNGNYPPLIRQGLDRNSIKQSFIENLTFSLGKDQYSATPRDSYSSLALTVRDRLVERWMKTQQSYYKNDVKRVYYLSMEFLIGRLLTNNLINLEMHEATNDAMYDLGVSMEECVEQEWDAGLGNGGLGRLAACFLDSMATQGLPAYGYGIRYDYGIFTQKIQNGWQFETPDNWLRFGNPWELPRPEFLYPVRFYGTVDTSLDADGHRHFTWNDGQEVLAMAYDMPIPGYGNNTVNTLRLWSAKATREFDLNYFNNGDYVSAVENKNQNENITRVLYPSDSFYQGKELRLKQEYFFVSATLQDAIRRYLKSYEDFSRFADKVVFQLNDTHPAIAIPELMRLLLDDHGLAWDAAWDITSHVFGYTNHTVMPEALEHWSVGMMEHLLPRHLHIIREINRRFLADIDERFPNDQALKSRMSILTDGPDPQIRMAHLAIVGSFSVNGVAALHTQILKDKVFPDFDKCFPGRFNNKTNGITPRRWLHMCNEELSSLITRKIGDGWMTNLDELKALAPFADDRLFREKWQVVKRSNKIRLAEYIRSHHGMEVPISSMFDCQVKRIHEYKRQLLNILGIIAQYNRIKDNPDRFFVPRTAILAGKAAPSYTMAKLFIRLVGGVADVVNNDPDIGDRLKVIFLANYSVSLAEIVIPAADLSQQISTAGMEASGTGNMKFALNGALTLGTLDGANVEIREEVGDANIFIFGLTADEVLARRSNGYRPADHYDANPELKRVIDQIGANVFSPSEPGIFQPILDYLLKGNDPYMVMADFDAYMAARDRIDTTSRDREAWTSMSIRNVAAMGKFSSDRAIAEYSHDIWHVQPVKPQE